MSFKPTTLGFALLGLLEQRPRTGYAVRKVFEDTPMGHYSSSPGSIYPALRRLEENGLIEETDEEGRSSSRSRFFRLTTGGRRALRRWLRGNIEREDVERRMHEMLLRFAFMDTVVTPADRERFLSSLHRHTRSYLRELEAYRRRERDGMSAVALLAFEFGIEGCRAHVRWAASALQRLQEEET